MKMNVVGNLTRKAEYALRDAADLVVGENVRMSIDVVDEPGEDVFTFDVSLLARHNALGYLAAGMHRALRRERVTVPGYEPEKVLYLDIESHNAEKMWNLPRSEFFRLGQYAWGPTGGVALTRSLDEVLDAMHAADLIIAHNGHPFDFSVLLGNDALTFARERRLFDPLVYANLSFPSPAEFHTRSGQRVLTIDKAGKSLVGGVRKWLGLDNLAFQFGVPGKMGDLKALAKKYNPKGTKVADYDYGLIPLDDPEFIDYARQDIVTLQDVVSAMMVGTAPDDYDWREQLSAAINAQMTRNGFRVDVPAATARVQELEDRKQDLMARLVRDYDFPTEGAMPWRSSRGKAAIFKILADHGITPQTKRDWPLTDTGNPSLSGDALVALTEGTEVEDLGEALAELQGQRPLAKQALDNTHQDGRVHHDIAALQRSGRSSTTRPSLTTWSAHGPKAVEKRYFIASEGRKLMEFDLSNADQRVLAALSGDRAYAKRFEEGVDGHEINARIMFTDAVYESDPKKYRNLAKAPGHAWTYGAGPKRLAFTTGLPLAAMYRFADGMAEAYPTLTRWQTRIRNEAEETGYTVNRWGRVMPVEPGRAWTQTPALQGQSGTTEVLKDGLIRMLDKDPRLIFWIVGTVHDALVADVPEEHVGWAAEAIRECMETSINGIDFPVESGTPADDWFAAGH